ncbi:MAG: DUF5107 domain-containing protein [Tepidisphaerales bacterium]
MKRPTPAPSSVRLWEAPVEFPTYPAMPADLNPMFFEKRVYQGSSGKVYPLPFVDRVSHEKVMRSYTGVYLENEYVRLLVLPEIGGRIHVGVDKTNNYDFIYRNRVIKPRLVGLCGPWISGGIEFNWPQHHRPTTFSPVDYRLVENADGSRTVWVGEHEPLNRTKGMAGITLHPGKSYVEVRGQLFNRTPLHQTFLWWANPAVHVHEQYQSFFPDDVDFVADHAKRGMSLFPVAKGTYYLVDYSPGTDIAWYRNIPVPTSYMVVKSQHDFFGGYDHNKQAGIIHIASHHVSPGKKQWTWGSGDFGQAWDRNLTDDDGPYIELMAGVYTDNQPDFSWLAPYETRTFRQFWYPFRDIGPAKMANIEAAANLEVSGEEAKVGVYTTSPMNGLTVVLKADEQTLLSRRVDCSPEKTMVTDVKLPRRFRPHQLELSVYTSDRRLLIRYRPRKPAPAPTLEPARAAPDPADIDNIEQLYLTGLHIEQYRHATCDPDPYYAEALRRDPRDARANNAMGLLLLRRGEFPMAERHFRTAIATLTQRNPNPRDGESHYNLGLALLMQERIDEAYDAFYKATWNYAWQAAAFFHLAMIEGRRGRYQAAVDFLNESLARETRNTKVRALRAAYVRRLGCPTGAAPLAAHAADDDPLDALDALSRNELRLLGASNDFVDSIRNQPDTYLDLALDYAAGGLLEDAIELLQFHVSNMPSRISKRPGGGGSASRASVLAGPENQTVRAAGRPARTLALLESTCSEAVYNATVSPLVYYHLADLFGRIGKPQTQHAYLQQAAKASSDYCFPSRLESIGVLRQAIALNPADAKAPYYLGNLLYDKRQYDEAISLWEKSRKLDSPFSIVHRNLALAYHNRRHDLDKARRSLSRALAVNPKDARLLFELDQLEKRANVTPAQRLKRFDKFPQLVEQRDDLCVERAALLNLLGRHDEAIDLMTSRRFSPWEGGEGKVTEQWVMSHILRALACIRRRQFDAAIAGLEAATAYPHNLGEGKLPYTPDTLANWLLGRVYDHLGDPRRAGQAFAAAADQKILLGDACLFQALAMQKLGRKAEARKLLGQLLQAGNDRLKAPAKIDYFAISLPNMLVFEDDLARRNQIDGRHLIALAQLGLGKRSEAKRELRRVLKLENSHLRAAAILANADSFS